MKDYIENRVEKIPFSGCWIWMGATNEKGYGIFSWPKTRKTTKAHRASFEAFVSKIPDGLSILHRCDTPPCCNPSHLFLGTIAQNNADMSSKGRVKNQNTGKTHCVNGHQLLSENVLVYNNKRYCKACGPARKRIWRQRHKAL